MIRNVVICSPNEKFDKIQENMTHDNQSTLIYSVHIFTHPLKPQIYTKLNIENPPNKKKKNHFTNLQNSE